MERKECVGNNLIGDVPKLYFPTFLVKLEGASAENKHTDVDVPHSPGSNV